MGKRNKKVKEWVGGGGDALRNEVKHETRVKHGIKIQIIGVCAAIDTSDYLQRSFSIVFHCSTRI